MRPTFDRPTTVRVKPDVREQIQRIAEAEGNHESAVIRRALAAGLAVIGRQYTDTSPDRQPAA